MKKIIVVGSNGQDGRILCERLRRDGCTVLGIARDSVQVTEPCAFTNVDITDARQVRDLVANWHPDCIHYLAAHHHSSQDPIDADPLTLFEQSHAVHVRGLLHFLDAIRIASSATRLFYAASSLVFGDTESVMQDETTPMNPRCIYGITKAGGVHCCRFYRDTHGVFASAGILYNHESVQRQEKFVSQKIIRAATEITGGRREKLILGDLSARIDWGYAPDFTDAMVRILALPKPGDFVVATGEAHSVQEFVEIAFSRMGLDWKAHVEEVSTMPLRKRRTLIGDSTKLHAATGWKPTVTFTGMVERLLEPFQNQSGRRCDRK